MLQRNIVINAEDVLAELSEADVVAYYGPDELLKEIGQVEAMAYFGIEPN